MLPAFVLGLVDRRLRHALHAVGGARGGLGGLRARRTSQGPARADRRLALHSAAAAPAVVTVLGLVFAFVLAGSVFVESVFAYPGSACTPTRARRRWTSRRSRAAACSSRSIYIMLNFVVDVLYGLIDPRIRDDMSAHELSRVRRRATAGERVARRRLCARWQAPLVVIGVALIVAWLIIAIFAPLISPHDPHAAELTAVQAPSGAHLFGTDELGRDMFSRVIYGARISLPLASCSSSLARHRHHARRASRATSAAWVDGLIMRTDRPRLRLPGDHPRARRHGVARQGAAERRARARDRLLAGVRARHARPRALDRRLRVRRVRAPARRSSRRTIVPGRAAELHRPGASCSRCSRSAPRCCCSRASRSSGSARSRRRGMGRDGRRGRRVLPVLVDEHVPRASRSSPPCSRSTSSATGCATSSTRARAAAWEPLMAPLLEVEDMTSQAAERQRRRSRSSTASTSRSSRARSSASPARAAAARR